jgi:putative methanogenesis marker protein 5
LSKKIFICPPNSLVLSDLVERLGHIPLTAMEGVKSEIEGNPVQKIFEPKRGLKYAPVEVPSGVRGRLSIIGRLIEEADAAIIMDGADFGFGCGGCARTNELIPYIVTQQGMPFIRVRYPKDLESTRAMIRAIKDFLVSLEEAP